MNQAKSGDTVRIHYTGKLSDGTEFDSSAGRDPLEFSLGSGNVIPGFDNAVDGMTVGDEKTVTIPPEQAYGPKHEQLIQDVPKTALPPELSPEVGMRLQSRTPDGRTMHLVVTDVADESITVDGNHPLAGEDLTFDIKLVAIG
jgi:peptidylprolyl isomerase